MKSIGLWEGPLRTLANAQAPPGRSPRVPNEPRDLELILDPEFVAADSRLADSRRSRELQLVLDPEFL